MQKVNVSSSLYFIIFILFGIKCDVKIINSAAEDKYCRMKIKPENDLIHKMISPLRPVRSRANFTTKKSATTTVLGNIGSVPHAEQILESNVDQASCISLTLVCQVEVLSF